MSAEDEEQHTPDDGQYADTEAAAHRDRVAEALSELVPADAEVLRRLGEA